MICLSLEIATPFSKNEIQNPVQIINGIEGDFDLSLRFAGCMQPNIGLEETAKVILDTSKSGIDLLDRIGFRRIRPDSRLSRGLRPIGELAYEAF